MSVAKDLTVHPHECALCGLIFYCIESDCSNKLKDPDIYCSGCTEDIDEYEDIDDFIEEDDDEDEL